MAKPRHGSAGGRANQRAYPRAARLNALLHEVLAEQLERIADHDERLGLLTLTGVACEPDLRHAVVFLATLSDESHAVLEEHRRELQAAVAAQVRTRRVPALSFEPDPAIAAASRVEEALARARRYDAEHPPAPGGADGSTPPDLDDGPDAANAGPGGPGAG